MLSRRDFGLGAVTGAGALAAMSSGAAEASQLAKPIVSLNVLYPNHVGAKFDLAYYRAAHIPLVEKVMKPVRVTLIEGVTTPNGPAPFAMIAHIQFPSMEALQAAHANPAMAEVRADIAKFTDIKPQVMVGRSA